jgi:aspartate/methionine/tyrosine aminotransferase
VTTHPTTPQLAVAARAAIPPFHVMDVLAAAAERQRPHGDLVNLSEGQPSTPAPAAVREAATAAIDREVLGYTVALGI